MIWCENFCIENDHPSGNRSGYRVQGWIPRYPRIPCGYRADTGIRSSPLCTTALSKRASNLKINEKPSKYLKLLTPIFFSLSVGINTKRFWARKSLTNSQVLVIEVPAQNQTGVHRLRCVCRLDSARYNSRKRSERRSDSL